MNKVLVTGGAGFIGSNLIAHLLEKKYFVRCLDNLSTGSKDNIEEFMGDPNFEFIEDSITNYDIVLSAVDGMDYILHQAALGSVPRSIKDPLTSSMVNIEGTLNVFNAAVEKKIKRVVYAASSSTYGDSKTLPKVEGVIGKPLSPYAVTKLVNELYAEVFHKIYGLKTIGLRYFNVFGPKQNPNGPYAAVIPAFIDAILTEKSPVINGEGHQSRDFTFIDNVVQANMKAMVADENIENEVINVACGSQTTLNELFDLLKQVSGSSVEVIHGPERQGDVLHSLADISKANKLIGYEATVSVGEGLKTTFEWFKSNNGK